MDKATTEMDRAVQSLMKDWGELQRACEAAGADKPDAATMLLIELRAIRELLTSWQLAGLPATREGAAE